MNIQLEPGDEVVAAAPMHANGATVILVVTKYGRIYEISPDSYHDDYKIRVL